MTDTSPTSDPLFGVHITDPDVAYGLRAQARDVLRSFARYHASQGLQPSELVEMTWGDWTQVELGEVWVADDDLATFVLPGHGYAVFGVLREDGTRIVSLGGSPGSTGVDYVVTTDDRWLSAEDSLSDADADPMERLLSGTVVRV